jgi:hypothetical protein
LVGGRKPPFDLQRIPKLDEGLLVFAGICVGLAVP